MGNQIGGIAADALMNYIVRYERLQEEKDALAADQKEVMAEAKALGFDIPTIKAIIKERKMSEADRREKEALLDIYKAALGMLDGTPLGNAALDRLTPKRDTPKPAPKPIDVPKHLQNKPETDSQAEQPTAEEKPPEPAAPEEPVVPEITVEEARQQGKDAAASGQPVTSNPWPAGDKRRAAWDEGWCSNNGTGMEIPDAWKRSPKKKDEPKAPEAPAEAPANDDEDDEHSEAAE